MWLLFLSGDGGQLPAVVPIDDVPERPDPQFVGNLCHVIADVPARTRRPAAPQWSRLTCPGHETVDDTDRYWFRALHRAARDQGASLRMLCLATQTGIRQLTLDGPG